MIRGTIKKPSAKDLVDHLYERMKVYQKNKPAYDDRTLLCVFYQ